MIHYLVQLFKFYHTLLKSCTKFKKCERKIQMKNYFLHIIIWGIGVIISFLLALYEKDSVYGIAILWGMCGLYFVLYYFTQITKCVKTEKKKNVVSKTGVFSGRAFGIFCNMFVLQYIMELYQHILLCMSLFVWSGAVLYLFRKDIKNFFSENNWKLSYYGIYIAFNVLMSSIDSIIGFYCEDFLLINISQVALGIKIILMLVYGIISVISVVPDSFIMKVATRNEVDNVDIGC